MTSRAGALARGWALIARRTAGLRTVLLAIVGAPSYERYYALARRAHPDVPPMGKDEFCRHQMERRYNRPGSRCC